jgi:hypothetical protein
VACAGGSEGAGLYPHYTIATSELEDPFSLNSLQALSYWRTQAAVQMQVKDCQNVNGFRGLDSQEWTSWKEMVTTIR